MVINQRKLLTITGSVQQTDSSHFWMLLLSLGSELVTW